LDRRAHHPPGAARAKQRPAADAFLLLRQDKEAHRTPAVAIQQFVYCYCRKSQCD
jgi:hypothetical protein